MCHTVQKQAKSKQNSKEKSDKINTVKPEEKQTIFWKNQGKNGTKLTLKRLSNFLLKICTKIFWKFYCTAYTYT